MSIKEVSEASGLSINAIRTGIKNGVFPAFRINPGNSNSKYMLNFDDFMSSIKMLGGQVLKEETEPLNDGIRRLKTVGA